jgi:prepilin-type N-terminal cleavage/methylation domain-containing protein
MSRATDFSRPRRTKPSRQAGFSLIEMLVVIGLIAFLTAAIVAVIPRVGNAAKVASTRATIKKVDELLNDRINGFRRWIQKQDQLASGGAPSYVTNSPFSGSFASNPVQTRALAVKYAFRLYFPQVFSEFQTPISAPATHKPITESSECLYQFLTKGPLFDTEPPSGSDLKAIEIADTDNDGLPEIVDGWGQPLRFYRWPTRLVRPATTATGLTLPTSSSTPGSASGSTPGPLDEIIQPSGTTLLIPLTPLMIAMGGATPRSSVQPWKSGSYSLGQQVVVPSITPTPPPSFSFVFQCTAGGATGATTPSGFTTGPPAPAVGNSVTDGAVTWQILQDPLSIDPDDPYGVAAPLIGETNSGSTAIFPLTPNTWSVPLIVSCGTDGQLGLFEPNDTANFGSLAQPMPPPYGTTDATGQFWRDAMTDNITNHQQ